MRYFVAALRALRLVRTEARICAGGDRNLPMLSGRGRSAASRPTPGAAKRPRNLIGSTQPDPRGAAHAFPHGRPGAELAGSAAGLLQRRPGSTGTPINRG